MKNKEVVFKDHVSMPVSSLERDGVQAGEVPKLRVIVRSDIPKGYMMSQAMHAAIDYVLKHDALSWWQASNTLVVLEVANESKIMELAARLESEGIRHVVFRERAMGMQATSIAIDPDDARGKTLTKRLRLALSTV